MAPTAFPIPSAVTNQHTWSTNSQGTPKLVSVVDGSTILLSANRGRQYAEINNIGNIPIWITLIQDAVVNQGLRLLPGGSRIFDEQVIFVGQINAVTMQGMTTQIQVIEGVI